jgi:hypothetical protein
VLGLALFAVVSEEELRAVVRGGAAPARVEELAPDWEDFWLTRVVRALEPERRPPILEGFLAKLPAGELGEALAGLGELASAVHRKVPTLSREEAAEIAVHVLADGLGIALAGAGWELSADIDEPSGPGSGGRGRGAGTETRRAPSTRGPSPADLLDLQVAIR